MKTQLMKFRSKCNLAITVLISLCAIALLCFTVEPSRAAVTPPTESWRTPANDPSLPGNWWYDTQMLDSKLSAYDAAHSFSAQSVSGGALAEIDAVDPIPGYSRAAHRAQALAAGSINADAATTPLPPTPTALPLADATNIPTTPGTVTPKPTPITPVVITYPPQVVAKMFNRQAVTNMNTTGAQVGLATSPESQVLGMVGHPWWLYDHLDDFVGYYKDLQSATIRLPIEWKTIEATQGTYDFSEYDRVLYRLADEHFHIILQFSGVPKWAVSPDPDCQPYLVDQGSDRYCGVSPAHRADMQRMAQAIIRRYPFVRQYEFWNEPELFPHVGADIGDYLDLLYPFYESVKAVDPNIQVAATTLAGWDYIGWMYNVVDAYHGGLRPFDAVAYHPYNFGGATDENGKVMPFLEPRIVELHNNMTTRGDGDKPLWLTEIGWQQSAATTPAMQAQHLKDGLAWVADKPYITTLDVHMLHDWEWEAFGMMYTVPNVFETKQQIDKNTKFIPKQPFYDAFKYAAKRLDVLSHQMPVPPNTAQVRYFPQTRHSVRGVFKTAWETRGGLALFGYPKTGQFWEFNPADNHYYLAQYFERVRMEWHPEAAGTQYEVQFGLLGNQLLMERGWLAANGQPVKGESLPASGPTSFQTNPLFFEQTGQYLGGPFRDAWYAQGGLAIVGYPKTGVFEEKNADTGQTYLVQYFERARMEYHPDAPPAYQVLFGLLGNDRLRLSGKLDPTNNQPIITDYFNPAVPEF